MASIAELIDSRQYARDSTGKEAATRVFRVLEAQNEAGARDAFYALTDYNRFPGAGIGCVLDRVNVEARSGNTLFIVTANYSSFKGFIKRDEPEESFVPFFGWGYKKVTITFPVIFPQLISSSSGDYLEVRPVWTAKTVEVAENRIVRTLKVRYQTDNSNTLDVISEQDRKIHTIRGKKYLFTGADVQQDSKDPEIFIITYNWEQDKGTRVLTTRRMGVYISGNGPPGTAIPIPVDTYADVSYICGFDPTLTTDFRSDPGGIGGNYEIRPPYGVVDLAMPNPIFNAQTGEYDVIAPRPLGLFPYEENPLGWQELPGMIPL